MTILNNVNSGSFKIIVSLLVIKACDLLHPRKEEKKNYIFTHLPAGAQASFPNDLNFLDIAVKDRSDWTTASG